MTTWPTPRRGGWRGSTQNTLDNAAMLGAEFWKPGTEMHCLYNREFATKYGAGYEFMLVKPECLWVKVDEYGHCSPALDSDDGAKKILRFSMPALAGFDMALQDLKTSGFDNFRHGDRVIIKCTGVQDAKEFGFSNMPLFELSVDVR